MEPDPDNPNGPDNSGGVGTSVVETNSPTRFKKRDECRNCGAKRGEGGEWYDDDYCSGKCKKLDGGEIPRMVEQTKISGVEASLEDYLLDYPKGLGGKDSQGQRIKGRIPKRYRRRHEPERLNWGEPLTSAQLKQAGLRAHREPIPGDWDYVSEESGKEQEND